MIILKHCARLSFVVVENGTKYRKSAIEVNITKEDEIEKGSYHILSLTVQ